MITRHGARAPLHIDVPGERIAPWLASLCDMNRLPMPLVV